MPRPEGHEGWLLTSKSTVQVSSKPNLQTGSRMFSSLRFLPTQVSELMQEAAKFMLLLAERGRLPS